MEHVTVPESRPHWWSFYADNSSPGTMYAHSYYRLETTPDHWYVPPDKSAGILMRLLPQVEPGAESPAHNSASNAGGLVVLLDQLTAAN